MTHDKLGDKWKFEHRQNLNKKTFLANVQQISDKRKLEKLTPGSRVLSHQAPVSQHVSDTWAVLQIRKSSTCNPRNDSQKNQPTPINFIYLKKKFRKPKPAKLKNHWISHSDVHAWCTCERTHHVERRSTWERFDMLFDFYPCPISRSLLSPAINT